jgi:hypothetical protein
MKKILVTLIIIAGIIGIISVSKFEFIKEYGAPPYGEEETNVPEVIKEITEPFVWKRPDGPLKVGVQAGHWKNSELPDELERIRNNGGTSNGKTAEWQVNLKIAEEIEKILEPEGIVVDILPATIPPDYWADTFISIHADGSLDKNISGFKVASPWRDRTGKASMLVKNIEDTYEIQTGLEKDPNITRNMRGYYAFSWWRYEHAINPMTPAVIVETGFLTNPSDARMLINQPEVPAQAISDAVRDFLKNVEIK